MTVLAQNPPHPLGGKLTADNTAPGSLHSTYNAAHIWLSVGSPKPGNVSSGGVYHDRCGLNATDDDGKLDYCQSTLGGQWTLDVNTVTGAYLYLNYAGYDAGGTLIPNTIGSAITVYAVAGSRGNYNGSDAACYYQAFGVHVTWYDGVGTYHDNAVGTVYFAHLYYWAFAPGTRINPNQSMTLGSGSPVSYIGGIYVGSVYNGTGACSFGPHVHVEASSNHGQGAVYEWHGEGPDYFWDTATKGDVHGGNASQGYGYYSVITPQDSVTWGTTLGFLGGGTTSSAAIFQR